MRLTSVWFVSSLLLAGAAAAGCSDDASPLEPTDDASAPAPGTNEPREGGAASTPPRADAGVAAPPPSCEAGEGPPAPMTPDEVEAWLRTRVYLCWSRETSVHPSAGPHGGNVRTYMNTALVAALTTDGARPPGAVAVKELYGSGTADVTGWAFMVKTKAGTAKDSWYWLETFGTTPGASRIEGQGKALCEGCHAAGTDYTLTPFPLR